jgi:hypothetical protein
LLGQLGANRLSYRRQFSRDIPDDRWLHRLLAVLLRLRARHLRLRLLAGRSIRFVVVRLGYKLSGSVSD